MASTNMRYHAHSLLACCPAALKGQFVLPILEAAIMQFDTELCEFGPNLQEVRAQLDACHLLANS